MQQLETLTDIEFNEDESDCLQELMNIAYGSATAAISEVLNSFATLNIPKVQIIPANELKDYLKEKLHVKDEQFVATQLISGNLAGENLFLIDTQSAVNLAHEFGLDNDEINDEELFDIILEVTNILSSSTLGRLTEDLNATIAFSPPGIQKITAIDKLENRFADEYNHIIVISTELTFDDQKINGELLLLTKDNSIIWLKEALNRILDEL